MPRQHHKEIPMRYLFITLLLCCTFAPTALAQPSIFEVVGRGDIEVIQEAFNSWADPNATDENDDSILMQAVRMNRLDIVDVLLSVNADVNFQNNFHNSLGQTALMTAIRGGADVALIERLLKAGADPNQAGLAFVGGGETGEPGYSPLMEAAYARRADVVHLLLDNGANVNYQTAWGETALMRTVYDFNTDICSALLAAGADVDHVGQIAPDLPISRSVLGHAIFYRLPREAIDALVERSALLYSVVGHEADIGEYAHMLEIAQQESYDTAVPLILAVLEQPGD